MQKQALLLDVCCGPCAISAIEKLQKTSSKYKQHEIILYINNSNIFPKEEYDKRLIAAERIAEYYKLKLNIDKYDHEEWLNAINKIHNYEAEREGGKRCELCYEFRLEKTAEYALKHKFSAFASTLTSGPMKYAEKINAIGRKIAEKHNIIFIEEDFKQEGGFQKSIEVCKKLNIYRQKYCGCEFSLRIKK